jgi:hypothetical protein
MPASLSRPRELYAPPGATDHPYYNLATAAWASNGPLMNYGQHDRQPEHARIAADPDVRAVSADV